MDFRSFHLFTVGFWKCRIIYDRINETPLYYLDIVLCKLKDKAVGCHIGHMYAGCLAYADDITLVALSVSGLQKMLQVCEEFGFEYGVKYNSGKTECILFIKTRNAALGTEPCVYLNNCKLKWKTRCQISWHARQ